LLIFLVFYVVFLVESVLLILKTKKMSNTTHQKNTTQKTKKMSNTDPPKTQHRNLKR
jgi:hypothetical protein